MKAADIMVTDVVTADESSSVSDIAKLLIKNNISALPVVDKAGQLLGIVSEGDLVCRAEIGTSIIGPGGLSC